MKSLSAITSITESILAGKAMKSWAITLAVLLALTVVVVLPARAQTGVYTLNGGTASQTSQTYTVTLTDQSAVYVLNSGHLTLTNCTMAKSGDASNVNNSSQYGINAGILANSAGTVMIYGGSVTTNALGANGLFATGAGSSISMSDATIHASGESAHGVDVTYSGSINLTNVNVTTTGGNASALATDFGGGTVTVQGGTILTSSTTPNSHSAGIYSTGNISVSNATVTSLGDCGGVIDGANSISLTNTALTGSLEGIKIWKTGPFSGTATVTIVGGSLTATAGDAFYVTGETGNAATAAITVSGGAVINASIGNLIQVVSSSTATLTANNEMLTGNLDADANSSLTVKLQNSTTLTGYIQHTALTIDATSSWSVTANSILTTFSDSSGISGLTVTNIIGNGCTVYYNSSLPANAYLGGLTYSLVNGGSLTPIGGGSNLDVTLTPINPPIQIPASGGNFQYNVSVANNGTQSATFNAWIMALLPSQTWYGPVLGPLNLTLSADPPANAGRAGFGSPGDLHLSSLPRHLFNR